MAEEIRQRFATALRDVARIARKEFQGFFASPTAFIFLGAFLGVALFIFFWVETFFARNIADVRPLFEWMPMLLIFLVAAITMRMWSEERRAGTLELLLTAPVAPSELVFGKFLACLALVGVALLLTLPLPLTVSQLGALDWGPVVGGYVATLFLAGAYIAIGLFVSARSDNAIVSLIATALLCGVFYAIGSDTLTGLFGTTGSELLKLVGSGARFESITRGVIDLRDLYYYASLVGIFLTLNVLVLEWIRWAGNPGNSQHRRWALLSALMVANFAAANLWLAPVGWARADITQGNIYSISDATRRYLDQLREPLLLRGYFSAQTHPLLAPLVPRLRDLLREYAEAGDGKVRVEFIDPLEEPELEQEASEKFGIRPVPFQTADKYQASVVNSYFDVLVHYGDEYETLNFWDLIEVKTESETEVEVELRNPEYDITRAIKKVFYAYQKAGDVFENIRTPVVFRGYVSPAEKLPASLAELRGELEELLAGIAETAGEKLVVEFEDPDAGDGALADELGRQYGFQPMVAGLGDRNPFWFYLTLHGNGQVVQVPFPEDGGRSGLERGLNAGIRRFSAGLLRTVALYTPTAPEAPPNPQFAPQQALNFTWLRDILQKDHTVQPVELTTGRVPTEADLLLLVAPKDLNEKQLFAVDQFLMQGGTVVVSTSPFAVNTQRNLATQVQSSGLEAWFRHHGIDIAEKLVLDRQSGTLPVPMERRLGAIVIREVQMLRYPYFVDVRGAGLDRDSGLTGGLQQITVHWPSPIELDAEKNAERRVVRVLESSAESWASESVDLIPNLESYGDLGFPVGADEAPQLLAAVVEGRFDSYFRGRDSPLLAPADDFAALDGDGSEAAAAAAGEPAISRVIDKSPESARLIVFASETFLSDELLNLSSQGLRTRYQNPIQLVENAVDWSFEDRGLLMIRGRAQFSRTLEPLPRRRQIIWEYGNYGAAVVGLALLWILRLAAERARQRRYEAVLRPARS